MRGVGPSEGTRDRVGSTHTKVTCQSGAEQSLAGNRLQRSLVPRSRFRRCLSVGVGPWFSFLRFVWNADGGGVASINPVILDTAGQMVPSDPSFPIRWLFKLLFREAFRQALKTGQPIVCPFKDFKISCSHEEKRKALRCNANCYFRKRLEPMSRLTELVSDDALCEIPTEAPEESGV